MNWTSALAIYVLFWAFSVFVVLPFGVRNHHETGDPLVPGQSDGAPANFAPGKIIVRTTAVATILFALFYLAYASGWVMPDLIALLGGPEPGVSAAKP